MRLIVRFAGVIAGLAILEPAFAVPPAAAHHTFVTKYDSSRKVTLTGAVVSVRYANPHIFFTIRVPSGGGLGALWRIETESIPKAQAKGLTRERLKPGAQVTVTAWPARDGRAEAGLSAIRLPDGGSLTMRGSAR